MIRDSLFVLPFATAPPRADMGHAVCRLLTAPAAEHAQVDCAGVAVVAAGISKADVVIVDADRRTEHAADAIPVPRRRVAVDRHRYPDRAVRDADRRRDFAPETVDVLGVSLGGPICVVA